MMDPGTKVAIFIGAGVLVLGGGWALFHWLGSVGDDPTSSEGEEADDPAETEGPPTGSSKRLRHSVESAPHPCR
jgi:hypothetical protein